MVLVYAILTVLQLLLIYFTAFRLLMRDKLQKTNDKLIKTKGIRLRHDNI